MCFIGNARKRPVLYCMLHRIYNLSDTFFFFGVRLKLQLRCFIWWLWNCCRGHSPFSCWQPVSLLNDASLVGLWSIAPGIYKKSTMLLWVLFQSVIEACRDEEVFVPFSCKIYCNCCKMHIKKNMCSVVGVSLVYIYLPVSTSYADVPINLWSVSLWTFLLRVVMARSWR